MPIHQATRKLIEEFNARPTRRASSLIMTVFGDSFAPRGGSVWLGSLIRALGEFGISERLVRTSVFRLSRDGWLESQSVGRRSYYGLTVDGALRFHQATQRIYGEPRQRWRGEWCIVLLAGLAPAARDALRKDMIWLGFGSIGAGLMVHPEPDRAELDDAIARHGGTEAVVVLGAKSGSVRHDHMLRGLAAKSWNLADIDARYAAFIARFRPVCAALRRAHRLEPLEAFLVRSLAIQEYRRILLRDPQLPPPLLPADWHGLAAYRLCRELYLVVYADADRYLDQHIETAAGPLPSPAREFYDRFGGLRRNKS
ncbi:MAG: phenylacetic acid degradation operon negative regulatory protein PaaX [Gammaproteobacteria bacterium]|nr:phenylacetic acid degradation operon negative regulatory protein PaaX [Gammaproteobacteria bacterium]MDH4253439.1 phenylacetic acid degradation operon negative regulatory protein PaaX [Gammaproteobacteria bacterium]MDH5309199.1 phenylacetic acid degradation operon negative regulatory protein PaaX [Gammaproteobacteria bacterium]